MHPPALRELASRIQERRTRRFGLDVQERERIAKFELEYPDYDLPWFWLSLAINNPADESESVLERMSINPWDSTDPEVSMIWRYLASRENLPNLEKRQSVGNLNGSARKLLDRALASARGVN